MTKQLYLEDSYMKECDSEVYESHSGKVILNQTIFYPESGGQPSDIGQFLCNGKSYNVLSVKKEGDTIIHTVEPEGILPGDTVTCVIDWDKRYRYMRSHTASHILSGVIHAMTGAKITGNQIGFDQVRIDFDLENFDREQLKIFEQKANEIIAKNHHIDIVVMPKDDAFKIPSLVKLKIHLPHDIVDVRVVDIHGFDLQACAGTHVKTTSEIGSIELIKAENKGKNNRRVYYRLIP